MDKITMENDSDTKMSSSSIDDLALIENETFDFDLPVSPQECHGGQLIDIWEKDDEMVEDEDEVFIGPVGFKEKCVATNAELAIAEQKPMSPPTAEQYASLFKEAMSVSLELQRNSSKSRSSSSNSSDSDSSLTKASGRKTSVAPALDSIQESSGAMKERKVGEKYARCEAAGDSKSELECFKREVKKEIRCPVRRGTVTIATNVPSPYPTAKDCTNTEPKRDPPAKVLHPRPPAQGVKPRGRGSMLPTRGLRRPAPVSARQGDDSAAPHNYRPEIGTTNPQGSTKIPSSGIQKPAVKKLVNPKVSGLKRPGFTSGSKSTNGVSSEAKTDSVPATKLPTKKIGLIKPSAISRPTHRNGTAGPAANKHQPMKATMSFGAGAATNGTGPSKRTTITPQVPSTGKRKNPTPRAATPSTPVFQEKKVVPKRLLGSGAGGNTTPAKGAVTPRRCSISTLPRPSTPVQPSTPHTRHTSITVPLSSAGPASARRRSGIPTPNRRASTSTRPASRLAVPTAISRPQSAQAAQKESSRFSPLLLSPLLTPPQFKLSPEGPEPEEKVAIKPFHVDDSIPPPNATISSSPELPTPELTSTATKTPHPDNVLRTRTNLQETVKEAGPVTKVATPKEKPSVGMLIDFGSATPKDKKGSKTPKQLGRAAIKENLLIDF
ncbi:G2 and S phase-expressed protein 1 [Strongylocentrotus purpuratus]|uniref:G2 and S phase-expressed protein 1 N-terminal domain-containing protein n=1 Tax=Strongylocentrotus purpuratus TaxID=7668 RepID=A0A7M7RH91_STRPU|nr:G2 and S phase-expressed protein 1 [Strongylocentrotus purpuratus]